MNQQGQMAMGGPVNAPTPNGGGASLGHDEVLKRLNTAIYDYLLRHSHYDVARAVSKGLPMFKKQDVKQSPNQRNGQQPNGVDDAIELDGKDPGITGRPDDLPFPDNVFEGPFLQDWWFQFWEIHFARRNKNPNQQTNAYVARQRMEQKARMGMISGGMDPTQMRFNGMVQGMNNSMAGMPPDLKRTAMQNRGNMTPHQLAALNKMQGNQQMQGSQMERSGSQMDMSGPRSGSPGSGDAPSPKRQRLEGGNIQQMNQGRPGQPGQMQGNQVGLSSDIPSDPALAHTHSLMLKHGLDPAEHAGVIRDLSTKPTNIQVQNMELYAQSLKLHTESAMTKTQSNTQKGMPPNIGPGGAQGSPMSQQGMDGATTEFYAAANGRMPMPNNPQAAAAAAAAAATGQAGGNGGNHALQDYQMQLMLLEQQNKKRLLMARQEQDSMAHPGAQPNGQFPPGASPQGIQRAGNPSPNPSDMQRGMMDPSQVPPNMRAQMMQNGQMMRPPSSHPMGQIPTEQQRQMMMQGQMMANGSFPPGQQPPGGMMPGQQGPGGQPMGTPRQQNSNMPPPPAPPATSGGTGPSSPSQQSAAPPTPSQTNKPKPGAKNEPKKKGAANKKGGAAPNATPASEAEQAPTPTPATPITPMNAQSFGKNQQLANGQAATAQQANAQAHNQNQQQQQQQQNAVQPPVAGGQPDMNAPFGSLDNSSNQFADIDLGFSMDGPDVLDNFDFDSFLNQDGDGFFDANLAFGDPLDAGIENAN